MNFIVSSTELLNKLQLINGVISTNSVLPILEDFLFQLEEGKLTILATDLETSMSTIVEVEAKESGKVAIPAKILVETLRNLPEQPITFLIDDKTFAVEITTSNGVFKLAGENGEEYPRIAERENVSSISISSEFLHNAISKTLFATSNDELRPAMTGVYFRLDEEGVTFVATDAHKLVKYIRSNISSAEPASFIVPRKALQLAKGAIPAEELPVEISYNASNAFFKFGDTNLICRLIDHPYPDFNAVIPKDNENTMTIGKREFQMSLRRISIFSNKTTHQVVMKIAGSELQVSAQDLDFSSEANERLVCTYDGPDMEIAFNARFLVEMLGVMDGDEVSMKLSTSTRAGILVPSVPNENEDLMMLIMPVMVNTAQEA